MHGVILSVNILFRNYNYVLTGTHSILQNQEHNFPAVTLLGMYIHPPIDKIVIMKLRMFRNKAKKNVVWIYNHKFEYLALTV